MYTSEPTKTDANKQNDKNRLRVRVKPAVAFKTTGALQELFKHFCVHKPFLSLITPLVYAFINVILRATEVLAVLPKDPARPFCYAFVHEQVGKNRDKTYFVQ